MKRAGKLKMIFLLFIKRKAYFWVKIYSITIWTNTKAVILVRRCVFSDGSSGAVMQMSSAAGSEESISTLEIHMIFTFFLWQRFAIGSYISFSP